MLDHSGERELHELVRRSDVDCEGEIPKVVVKFHDRTRLLAARPAVRDATADPSVINEDVDAAKRFGDGAEKTAWRGAIRKVFDDRKQGSPKLPLIEGDLVELCPGARRHGDT